MIEWAAVLNFWGKHFGIAFRCLGGAVFILWIWKTPGFVYKLWFSFIELV